ncbi:Hypothetical predicted protein [Cloeon dipterum]|uniref:Uncharacterized protein n=1 Tax=Cloeon dipterum TaxID=197152 RepID=A0A8S1CKY3_9INSE|nr:Hypothetical predicted protein [Cloeon dipterum]
MVECLNTISLSMDTNNTYTRPSDFSSTLGPFTFMLSTRIFVVMAAANWMLLLKRETDMDRHTRSTFILLLFASRECALKTTQFPP